MHGGSDHHHTPVGQMFMVEWILVPSPTSPSFEAEVSGQHYDMLLENHSEVSFSY